VTISPTTGRHVSREFTETINTCDLGTCIAIVKFRHPAPECTYWTCWQR
jgi:hypothetical protein